MEMETELEAEMETNRNSPRRQLKKLFKFLSLVVVGFFFSSSPLLRIFRFSLTLVFVINYFAGWRQGQREEEEKEEEQKLLLQP